MGRGLGAGVGTRVRHRGNDRRLLVPSDAAGRGDEHTAHRHVRAAVPGGCRRQFRGHRRRHQVPLHAQVSAGSHRVT